MTQHSPDDIEPITIVDVAMTVIMGADGEPVDFTGTFDEGEPEPDPLPPDWMRVAGEMTAGRALAAQLAFFFRTSDPTTFREIRRLLAIYQVHIGVEPIARPYECQACGFTTVSLDDLAPGGGHLVYTEAPYGSQERFQRAYVGEPVDPPRERCPGPVVPYVPLHQAPRP